MINKVKQECDDDEEEEESLYLFNHLWYFYHDKEYDIALESKLS
jgi:hypothetical protein